MRSSSACVNATGDSDTGPCTLSHCTLRQAIDAANANPDATVIHFAIDAAIALSTPLPTVSAPLTIDGSGHKVVLDGQHNVRVCRQDGCQQGLELAIDLDGLYRRCRLGQHGRQNAFAGTHFEDHVGGQYPCSIDCHVGEVWIAQEVLPEAGHVARP